MSGRPNIQQIDVLRENLKAYYQLLTEREKLTEESVRMRTRLIQINDELQKRQRTSISLLAEMDCESSGNTGWQNRIMSLLSDLVSRGPGSEA